MLIISKSTGVLISNISMAWLLYFGGGGYPTVIVLKIIAIAIRAALFLLFYNSEGILTCPKAFQTTEKSNA